MRLDAPPLGPAVGIVVAVHVAQQQAGRGAVQDDADVVVDAGGPEILVR